MTFTDNPSAAYHDDQTYVDQYHRAHRNETLSPERALMLACLEDGIYCALGRTIAVNSAKVKRRQIRDSRQWIFSNDDDYVFSFRRICDEINVDLHLVRRLVHRRLHGAPRRRRE